MKSQLLKKIIHLLPIALCMLATVSCKKMFDVQPQDSVDQENMYRDVFDADAAVIGIYGKLLNLAKQHVVLNELRADLLDVTPNANEHLRQLNTHSVTPDNPYIDPQPFYEVILNCNDALMNFNIMLKENRIKLADYEQRYSDVGAIRSWVYLQLGIHFGSVPYITKPFNSVQEIRDQGKYPFLPFDALIDSLVSFTKALPYLDYYPAGTTLQTTVDGISLSKFFINKRNLLGQLYLWDNQYQQAAGEFKKIMELATPLGAGEAYYANYRVSYTYSFGATNYGLHFTNNTGNEFNAEWIWVLPFDVRYQPENPFLDIFSINGGSYLLRPSQVIIDNWEMERQVGGIRSDGRGEGSWRMINGQPVVMKYLYNYLDAFNRPNPFNKAGRWFLSRAADVHLHYAEAANRDRKHKIAYAITNLGIKHAFDPTPGVGGRNVTNIMHTLYETDPAYQFDAREGNAPSYRSTWYRGVGVRGRVNLPGLTIPAGQDSLISIENMIIDEAAKELAFEGHRWADLLRIAIRRNDPAFLADRVYNKLIKSGVSQGAAASAKSKLMSKNWFLPFRWNN